MQFKTIALDLEGTLISNVLNPLPRPGLLGFIEFCIKQFEEVVIMTAVPERSARVALVDLVDEGCAPPGFEHARYIDWTGQYKDLRFVSREHPELVLLVDDSPVVIRPDQEEQWIPVLPWLHPYPQDDQELIGIKNKIVELLDTESR